MADDTRPGDAPLRVIPNLSHESTSELLARWAPLQAELARRFGNSNIVGCYGEILVASALNGKVRANSAAGGDVELTDGRLVEVKSRRAGDSAGRHASGIYKWDRAIDGWPFDFAAFVQLDELTLEPVRAFVLDVERLSSPKPFGTKSPVLGQQLHGNRRYEGEIDLLPAMRGGTPIELPPTEARAQSQASVSSSAQESIRLAPPEPARQNVAVAPTALPRTESSGAIDWVWLGSGAIEDFKRWRMRSGATSASASSYASGARAFLRYCRSIERDPRLGDDGFLKYLEHKADVSPRARSDYQSHARAFVRFLGERGQR